MWAWVPAPVAQWPAASTGPPQLHEDPPLRPERWHDHHGGWGARQRRRCRRDAAAWQDTQALGSDAPNTDAPLLDPRNATNVKQLPGPGADLTRGADVTGPAAPASKRPRKPVLKGKAKTRAEPKGKAKAKAKGKAKATPKGKAKAKAKQRPHKA